jgi:hypothetical protein
MAEKRILHAHPSVCIVKSRETSEIFGSVYDIGYSKKNFVGSMNLLGGNPEKDSLEGGILGTLLREINEEIKKKSDDKVLGPKLLWADEGDIIYIRESVLENPQPYSDFYFVTDGKIRGEKESHAAIFSVFISLVSQEMIECAKYNINSGRRLGPEGLLGVFSLEMLASRTNPFTMAHATPLILKEYFNLDMPYPKGLVHIEKLGVPKKFYSDYDSEFVHTDRCWAYR